MSKSKNKRSIGHIKWLDNGKCLLRLSLGFDDFGKRIQPSKVVECTSDREAERLLLEFYNERERLKLQHSSFVPQTLGQLYNDWYTHHVTKALRPKTAEWYTGLWDRHAKYAENLKLENISPAHIRKIIDETNGARTKNAVYKMLNAMFNKAVKWGYLQTNPCQRVDTPKYAAPEKKALEEKEILLACEKIKEEETKYQAIFYFAILCSLRREEILGLRWSDIDFAHSEFHIKTAAIDLTGKGTVLDDTKTDKSKRALHMPDMLKCVLLTLRNEQNNMRRLYGDKWIDGNYVFTQQNGKLMNVHTASNWWREFSDKHGITEITNITLHGLRHTAATHMIKNNVPISTVSGVLGHANITTTLNTYTHVIEDTKKAAINVMADIITGTDAEAETQAV